MKGRSLWLLRALGLGLFAWLVTRADWAEFARVLQGVDATLLYVLPALTAIMIGLRAQRWNLLLAVIQQALPLGRVWEIYAIGLFLGSVTPGRLGDLAKAWYVRSEGKLDWDQAIVLVGLAAFLPISVAGFGTREGLLALVFAHRAVPNSLEMALAYSGLFFGFCFAVPALMGFACWLKNPLSLAELRKGTSKPLGKL